MKGREKREKKGLIKEYSLLFNNVNIALGLLLGLLLLPNLKEELRHALGPKVDELADLNHAIVRNDPKVAYDEALEKLKTTLLWFEQHPNFKLKYKEKNISPVKALTYRINALEACEEKFIESYLNGDYTVEEIDTIIKASNLLGGIEISLMNTINKIISLFPQNAQYQLNKEFITLATNKGKDENPLRIQS